jgi:hypothetical protein
MPPQLSLPRIRRKLCQIWHEKKTGIDLAHPSSDELPLYTIQTDPFCMATNNVTNQQDAEFLNAILTYFDRGV